MRNTLLPYLFGILFLFGNQNLIYSQCSLDQSIAIPDLTPISANLIIAGSTNDNLSGTQGVCGVSLVFEHEQIGDLTIELTSPAGQTITLIGPTGSFGNTSFTDWDILFLPCSEVASPDPGFTTKWNNNQSWGLLANYNGSYHPYLGCLEDFNTGSINGIWNIQLLDNTLFDLGILKDATIIFCDDAGLNCNLCEAYAGEFNESSLNVCLSEPDNIS